MATKAERFDAILNAMVDGTASNALKSSVRDAFALEYRYQLQKEGIDPDTMTNAQKAGNFLRHFRQWVREIIRNNDTAVQTSTANLAAAHTAATTAAIAALPDEVV
jgi:hypothetical protein